MTVITEIIATREIVYIVVISLGVRLQGGLYAESNRAGALGAITDANFAREGTEFNPTVSRRLVQLFNEEWSHALKNAPDQDFDIGFWH